MDRREAVFFAILYGTGALATFGLFYRDSGGRPLRRYLVYSLVWPLWWICAKGIGASLETFYDTFWGSDHRATVSLGLGLFTIGHYLSTHWSSCTSTMQCTGVVVESLATGAPQVGAIYWAWVLAQFSLT